MITANRLLLSSATLGFMVQLVAGCANVAAPETSGSGGAKGSGGSIGTGLDGGVLPPQERPTFESLPPPGACGNNMHDNGEECDDGNTLDAQNSPTMQSDGCTRLCQIEAGWKCPEVGKCEPPTCGDGILAASEACDDKNKSDGDGCSKDCKSIDDKFECRVPGKRCVPKCGDGHRVGSESCDDGNTMDGDGCSSLCLQEPGSSCDTSKEPNVCTKSVCGNGKVEAGESCDAGNLNGLFYGNAMGCSKTCTKEPSCRSGTGMVTTRACDTSCGNGSVETGEQCDDGNSSDGDGCSKDCKTESGFMCSMQMLSDAVDCKETANAGKKCLELPIIYRDFKNESVMGGHPDFFYLGATVTPPVSITGVQGQSGATSFSKRYCVPNSGGPAKKNDSVNRCWDLAAANLDPSGKPVFNSARPNGTNCDCQFIDWSHDGNGGHVPGAVAANSPTIGLVYTDGASGHPMYRGLAPIVTSAASFGQWFVDTMYNPEGKHSVGNLEMAETGTANQYQFSSQPNSVFGGFFPLDPTDNKFPLVGMAGAGPGTVKMMPAPWNEALLCNLWPYWKVGTNAATFGANCIGDQYLFPPSTTMVAGMWSPAMQGWFHDAWYTTEARYLFVYNDAFSLQFYGDDDMFIFINGVQVIDLGGVHQRLPGRVDVDGTTGKATIIEGGSLDATGTSILPCPSADPYTLLTTNAKTNADGNGHMNCTIDNCDCRTRMVDLKLEKGKTYEIAVFGSDRHPTESNYQLTLSGFATNQTVCTPRCGDGVTTGAEECDCGDGTGTTPDGCNGQKNDDGVYGACTTQCKYGAYCGDHHVDSDHEACDEGKDNGATYSDDPTGGTGCSVTCQRPHYCGDGHPDAAFGEQCDLGDKNGKTIDNGGGKQCIVCDSRCQIRPEC